VSNNFLRMPVWARRRLGAVLTTGRCSQVVKAARPSKVRILMHLQQHLLEGILDFLTLPIRCRATQ